MRNRVFLGALYYYFWAVPFFFSSEPVAAYLFAGLLGVATTALTFEIGRRLAGAPAGVASALVFATMPLAVIDGRMAWAPAALPVVCAGALLAVVVLVDRASLGAALVASVLAALAVQLHVAAAPLVLVVGVAIFSRLPSLGLGGVLAAAFAGVVTLLPQVYALTVPTPAGEPAAGGVDMTSGRVGDMLAVSSRAVAGISAAPHEWPGWVDAWIHVELGWMAVVVVCAVLLVLRLPLVTKPVGVLAVVGTLVTSWLAVVLLPWEAWYYYLDLALVPAALVVGLAVATALGRFGWWALLVVAAGRTAFVFWWISVAHGGGVVPANLELLRLGGPRTAYAESRARIPTVAARRVASDALVRGAGAVPPDVWQMAHGPGFSDLDTDNGYFIARAASQAPSGTAETTVAPSEALVVYRGQVPEAWRAGQGAPIISGPFEIFTYTPVLDRSRAHLVGCGGGPLPTRPVRAPLDYGDGALVRSEWPCDAPVVSIPFDVRDEAPASFRVFARLDGPGAIVRLEATGPASSRPIENPPPGLGRGIEIDASRGGGLRIALELVGPASLDIVELHGR